MAKDVEFDANILKLTFYGFDRWFNVGGYSFDAEALGSVLADM